MAETTSESCSFVFSFVPEGLPPTATFRVAVRDDLNGRWTILPEPSPVGGPQPMFESDVGVANPAGAPGDVEVQLAVLVFLEPPPPLPATVGELNDTGAYKAFLTPAVVVTSG